MSRFPSLRRYQRLEDELALTGHEPVRQDYASKDVTATAIHDFSQSGIPQPFTAIQEPVTRVITDKPSFPPDTSKYEPIKDEDEANGLIKDCTTEDSPKKLNTNFNPFFLRRWVLASFAILWLLVILALQSLYMLSQARKGLVTTSNGLRYLWIYGPTAIFVLVTICWRQVDYAAKYIQPWAELARGPVPAKTSLLLDYVTPFQVVALWRSLKHRHFNVASTITVFILIKIMTIVSTGLLVTEIVPFTNFAQEMSPSNAFRGDYGLPVNIVDARASTYFIGHTQYAAFLPNGTTKDYAFQSMVPSSVVPSDTIAYNASVDIFTSDGWTCETGNLTYRRGSDHSAVDEFGFENSPVMLYYNSTIRIPGCDVYNVHLDAPSWFFNTNDTTPRYGYWGAAQHLNCSNLKPTDPGFHRFTIAVAYSVGLGQDNNTMINSSHVVCQPSYSIRSGYVSVFLNGSLNGDILLTGQPGQISGISGTDIAAAVFASVAAANIQSPFSNINITTTSWLNLMMQATSNFVPEMLLDNVWLATKSRELYQQIGVQVAKLYLLPPADRGGHQTPGYLVRNELRLVVRALPTRLMQAFAGVMLLLTVLMVSSSPRNVVPRSIESIAGIATILARSPGLADLLRNTGHLGALQLSAVASNHYYQSAVVDTPTGDVFTVRVIPGSTTARPSTSAAIVKWTKPVVLHRFVMALIPITALSVLITVEVLHQFSNKQQGIIDVNTAKIEKYAWLYGPTFVLVLIATLFNMLDFELEFADPYHQLAHGYTDARTSLLWDPLRNVSLKTTWKAVRHSRHALVASSVAVLLAPLLTIAVSGLFVPQVVNRITSITLPVTSWFNTSMSGLAYQGPTVPSLVLQANMSYPKWTWDELALAEVDISGPAIANGSDGSINLTLPALRAQLNCVQVPDNAFYNLSVQPAGGGFSQVLMNISTPTTCGAPSYTDSSPRTLYSNSFDCSTNTSAYFGSWAFSMMDNCSDRFFAYGYVSSDRKVVNASLQRCSAYVEVVQTNATIDLGRQTVITPPVVEPGTAQYFSNWSFPTYYWGPYFVPLTFNGSNEVFDSFFNVMVHGQDGVPAAELLDPVRLVAQVRHTYRQWYAQVASSYSRIPLDQVPRNQTAPAATIPGTYSDPKRQRLFLTPVSTRVLEGVLAILVICGTTIFFPADMSRVFPKPVGSIGSVASLLAGSRFIDEKENITPRGSEWVSDAGLQRRRVWRDEQFRMGWWDDGEFQESGAKLLQQNVDTSYDNNGEAYAMSSQVEPRNSLRFGIDARPRGEVSVFE